MGESSSLLKVNEGKEEVTEPMKKWLLCQRKGENLGWRGGEKEHCRKGEHVLALRWREAEAGFELTTYGVRGGDANDYAKETDSPTLTFLKSNDWEKATLVVNKWWQ